MKALIRKGRYTENFVTLPNRLAQDRTVSFEARGLLTYLISKPYDWEIWEKALMNEGNCGSYVIRRIIKELVAAKYIIKKRERDDNGTFKSVVYEVFPEPQTPGKPPTCQKSTVDNPRIDNPPHTKERTLLNTDSTNSADGGDFDEFWKWCPRKVGKGAARTAYAKAIKKASHKTILNGIGRYFNSTASKDQQFIVHPARWLNEERWQDEPPRRQRPDKNQLAG